MFPRIITANTPPITKFNGKAMKTLFLSSWTLLPLVSAVEWRPGAPCPTEIHTRIGAHGDFRQIEAVHAAMLTCTNITTLALYGPYDDEKFLSYNSAEFPLTGLGWERYASAPEILILHDYNSDLKARYEITEWDLRWVAPWYPRWVAEFYDTHVMPYQEQREARRYPRTPNFERLLKAMDFSRIHTLELRGQSTLTENFARSLPAHLHNLQTLQVELPVAEKLILGLPQNSLKHLTWWEGWQHNSNHTSNPFDSILHHHGASLETLHFHNREQGGKERLAPSPIQLQHLTELAPGLTNLTLDLLRTKDGAIPWDDLRTLASNLPNLTDLTIHLDLASTCQHQIEHKKQWDLEAEFILKMEEEERHQERQKIEDYLWSHSPAPNLSLISPLEAPPSTCDVKVEPSDESPSSDGPLPATFNPWIHGTICRLPPYPPPSVPPAQQPCHGDCVGKRKYAQPMVNKESGEEVALFLQRNKVGKRLVRVRIRSGQGWGDVDGEYEGPWVDEVMWREGEEWNRGMGSWVSCFGGGWWEGKEGGRAGGRGMEGEGEGGDGGGFVCEAGENLVELREWISRCGREV